MVVHCRAGNGRTGVVLAMYLVFIHKKSALDAISMIRSLRYMEKLFKLGK